eukprot:CAMPEP_0203676360 /NCGR_PEP_ID=MMETSP0090-20130426/24285_1 /ASSEMBLY_ACC=CAM_ASM_001088 /TAXON_ID=426623 /ORGANISM="Chaetoceros affinis, Strain CCMP159" /LENGTH=761 /DNA_ID=CAMNT_0050542883 /DNA_START=64 /DNA_END=2349 /DNA_ORIENTATION=+
METDYNRPRRPNADTLSYLKSLPFNEVAARQEIEAYLNYQRTKKQQQQSTETDNEEAQVEEVEYPQNLSAAMSALDEIKNEVASLAGDEFGSQCLETITRITVPYSTIAARKLLHGISGYLVHLSTHRYGSHVVQTILQNALSGRGCAAAGGGGSGHDGDSDPDEEEICTILELDQQDEGSEEEEEYLPSMKDILIGISEELLPAAKQLAVHVCGSHVLRSLICILSGVEEDIPQHILNKGGTMEGGGNRRGKIKGKKKKKKKFNNDNEAGGGSGVTNNANFACYKIVARPRFDISDSTVQDCFFSFVLELTGIDLSSSDSKEQNQVGDLQQLVCNPSSGPLLIVILRVLTLAFGKTDINLGETDKTKLTIDENETINDFRLGIIGQQTKFEKDSFSEMLAKRIICWDDTIQDDSEQKQAGEVIYGLSGEIRGSHMLEVLLRTSNDDFYEKMCQAGRFFSTDAFVEYAEHDVSNFVIQTLLNTVRTRSQAESAIKCTEGIISNGFVLNGDNRRRGIFWRAVEMSAKFRIGQETILKSMRKGFNLSGVSDCVPRLICYQDPENDGGRIGLDAAGARTIYHLLRFVPRLCTEILEGILTKFSAEQLISICNDGLGSRCIIDGILEGPTRQEPFANSVKELCTKLKGHWVQLSVERVGHHTVKKIFLKLKFFEDKAAISEELSKGINRMSGNAMGRKIISECAVKDYMEGEDVWRSVVKKAMERESFLKEIVEGDTIGSTKKRKRKRKKKENDENLSKKALKAE